MRLGFRDVSIAFPFRYDRRSLTGDWDDVNMVQRGQWQGGGLDGRFRGRLAWLLAMGLSLLVACPTYEDTYTGTYQELDFDPDQEEVVEVEFYRFGANARAMVRTYRRPSLSTLNSPFSPQNQTRCVWTKAEAFDVDSRSFRLWIPPSARYLRTELLGELDVDGLMTLRMTEDGREEASRTVRLGPVKRQPDPDCDQIDDFLVYAFFNGTLDPTRHQLRHPVLAVMWVGVEPIQRDGVVFHVAFNRAEPVIRLENGRQYDADANGFTALDGRAIRLNFSIPPPSERLLVRSGETRYALAHLVVIDDRDREGRFSWEIADEPIVATALQRGRLPDGPEEANGWGRALLFVEGRLSELDRGLQARMEGLEEVDGDGHFYVVEVFYQDDEILALRLPPPVEAGLVIERLKRIPLQMTEDYLSAQGVLLPRLFP
jgi:hypothetical protein